MKQSLAILALFLGASQQVDVEQKPNYLERELEKEKFQLNSLRLSYKRLENKYNTLVSKLKKQGKPFAEGLGDEPVGQTISIQDTNTKSLHPVKFNQRQFAEGYASEEPLGETIRVAESGKLQPVKFSQTEQKFQTGIPDKDSLKQKIRIAHGGRLMPVKFSQQQSQSLVQKKKKGHHFSLAGKWGPGLPEFPTNNQPLSKPYGEKQWQSWAQDHVNWLDRQTNKANTRLPYYSTLQLDSESQKFSLAGKHGPGLPPHPANNAPLKKPRGEKQWQQWAQDLNDWSDKQTKAAQTRIPYKSTLQLSDDIPSNLEFIEMKDDETEESQELEDVQEEEDVDADIENSSEEDDDSESESEASDDDEIEKLEMLDIPRDTKLVEAVDDDVNKMESMILEDPDIPLNMRLVHLQNQDGDDIIKILN